MRGVFYRSDTRHPTALPDALFTNGFSKRSLAYARPAYRFPIGEDHAPDIVPQSAVCFTRHFEAAPLFPVGDLDTDAWVYVLDLDVARITNTQQSQYQFVRGIGRANVAQALWPMFGQERATNRVEPRDIVGAVLVERDFVADNVFEGGSFKPVEYRANAGYAGPARTADLAASLLQPLVDAKQWIPMPTQSQGIVASTRR